VIKAANHFLRGEGKEGLNEVNATVTGVKNIVGSVIATQMTDIMPVSEQDARDSFSAIFELTLNKEDPLIKFLSKTDNPISTYARGAFVVHVILFFSHTLLSIIKIRGFDWVRKYFLGSCTALFIVTNGVAFYAYYDHASPTTDHASPTFDHASPTFLKYPLHAGSYAIVQAADFTTTFLGFGPLKIIHNLLSFFYHIFYFLNAVFLSGVPVYNLLSQNPSILENDGKQLTNFFQTYLNRLLPQSIE
jgi:hypothetical protein